MRTVLDLENARKTKFKMEDPSEGDQEESSSTTTKITFNICRPKQLILLIILLTFILWFHYGKAILSKLNQN